MRCDSCNRSDSGEYFAFSGFIGDCIRLGIVVEFYLEYSPGGCTVVYIGSAIFVRRCVCGDVLVLLYFCSVGGVFVVIRAGFVLSVTSSSALVSSVR